MNSVIVMLAMTSVSASQQELPEEWIFFTSKEGGFLIALPDQPKQMKQKVKTATGQLEVSVFAVEMDRNSAYVVSYTDLPEKEVGKGAEERRLDHARDGALQSLRGKLREESKLELGGHRGREVIIEGKAGLVVRLRIYAVGSRVYQVLAMGPAGFSQTKESRLVLDSFRLNK